MRALVLLLAGWLASAAPADEHYQRAARLFQQRRFTEAAGELQASLRLKPGQLGPVRLLGLCHQLLGQPEEAEKAFLEAVRVAPSDGESWFFLGRVYYGRNFFDKALAALENAVRLSPADPRGHEHLALTREALGDVPGAVDAYRNAVRANDARPDPMAGPEYNFGVLLAKLDRTEEAERRLKRARQLAPADWRAGFELGKLYFKTGRLGAAAGELRSALAAGPGKDIAQVYRVLAQVYYRAGREPEAAEADRLAEAAER